MIHPALAKWFDIACSPEQEYSQRLPTSELLCWTPKEKTRLKPKPLHQILAEQTKPALAKDATRESLQSAWRQLLKLEDIRDPVDAPPSAEDLSAGELRAVKLAFAGDVPTAALLLLPPGEKESLPVVVAVAQGGKKHFLEQRAEEIAALLSARISVCLVDVRGTGETSPDRDAGQYSGRTSLSASQLMLGRPLLSGQLADLQRVLRYLRTRDDVAAEKLALWADSSAKALAADAPFKYPRRIDRPGECEPGATTLALVAALFDDQLAGVYARGGLASYASVLESPFVQVPHDAIIPGVLAAGSDLPQVVKAINVPVQLVAQVDGRNRLVGEESDSSASAWLRETVD
jgi:hypothetical protein